MADLFQKPTRGGKLTIVNCALWGLVVLGAVADIRVLQLLALVACWPAAWLCILPAMGGRRSDPSTAVNLVIAIVAIGVNSLLWGYGISWLMSLVSTMYRRAGPAEDARRGSEVVTAAPVEVDRESDPR